VEKLQLNKAHKIKWRVYAPGAVELLTSINDDIKHPDDGNVSITGELLDAL
jgi:hypothetical protein